MVIICAGNLAVGISQLPVHELRLFIEYPTHRIAKQSNKLGGGRSGQPEGLTRRKSSRQYARVIMASVSLSNLHPDFKLGFLLVIAASLLAAGSPDAFWYIVTSERLGVGASEFGWVTLSGGLGGLLVVAAVIWVDYRPPHVTMSAGSLVLAIGLALLFLSDTFVKGGGKVDHVGGSAG